MKDINLEEILGKAKEMQDQFQKMQHDFSNKEIYGLAGIDDADQIFVKVMIDGARKVKTLTIGEGALEQSVSVLTDLIIGAVNNATEKLNGEMQQEMQKIYSAPGALGTQQKIQTDDE
jgi:DNA-binding protein YbaB